MGIINMSIPDLRYRNRELLGYDAENDPSSGFSDMMGGFGGSTAPTFPDSGPRMPSSRIFTRQDQGATTQMPSTQQAAPPDLPDQPFDANRFNKLWADMMGQYTPETTATNRYNEMINNMPQRGHIGLGRTIAAMGLAAGSDPKGFENSQNFMERPYVRDVAAWKEQIQPAYNAANLERQANQNERLLMSQMATSAINAQKADETERYNRDRIRSQDENNRAKSLIAMYRAQTPDWDWDFTGPTVRRMNTKGNGEVIDTGIPTGKLTEEERIALQNEGRIAANRALGEAANQRVITGGGGQIVVDGRLYQPDGNGGYVPAPGVPQGTITRPGTPPRTPANDQSSMTPNEIKQDRINKSAQVKAIYPDLASYITVENGEVKMTQPKPSLFGGVSGDMMKRWEEARDFIFGDAMDPRLPKGGIWQDPNAKVIPGVQGSGPAQTPGGAPPQAQFKTRVEQDAAVKSGDYVYATGPDGKRGIIPKSMAAQAIRDGYQVDGVR